MKNRCIKLFLVFSFIIVGKLAVAQQTTWTGTEARAWATKKQSSFPSKVIVHPFTNYVEYVQQYHANPGLWDKAFNFLNDKKLDTLAPGKYVIDGDNVYAMITLAPSKEFDKSAWESHQKYIDLQHVIKGQEKIGIVPVSSAKVTDPYDQAKDIAHYEAQGTFYTAAPNTFFLFFPSDAHRPNIKVKGYDTVRKVVIKIKYAPLK